MSNEQLSITVNATLDQKILLARVAHLETELDNEKAAHAATQAELDNLLLPEADISPEESAVLQMQLDAANGRAQLMAIKLDEYKRLAINARMAAATAGSSSVYEAIEMIIDVDSDYPIADGRQPYVPPESIVLQTKLDTANKDIQLRDIKLEEYRLVTSSLLKSGTVYDMLKLERIEKDYPIAES